MRKESLPPLARALSFATLLALVVVTAPAVAQPKPAPAKPPVTPARPTPSKPATPGKPNLVDRVLAVVDEDPILQSDVDRVVRLGLQAPNPGEGAEAFRKRVLGSLIEDRLRWHEVDRFGFTEVPVELVEAEVTKIQKGFPDDRAFQKALADAGLTLQGLRQRMTQQLLIVTYVDERLGPQAQIANDEIEKYYQSVLVPEMKKRGQPAPPREEVRDQIREVLKQKKLTAALAKWTEELRGKADIVIHPEGEPGAALPPVVKKIGGAPSKPGA